MKRFFLILTMLAGAFAEVSAQDSAAAVAACDTVRQEPSDSLLFSVRRSGRPGEMVLQVAGLDVTFGRPDSLVRSKRSRRVKWWLLTNIQFGFARLQGVDYAGYAPEQGRFMELQHGKSFHFGFDVFCFSVRLNRRNTIRFSTGFAFGMDNYRLSDNSITLLRRDGRIVPAKLEEEVDKSKFVTTNCALPLRLSFEPARHLRLTALVSCDFAVGISSIYKHPSVSHELSGLNPVQVGVGGEVTFHDIGLFVRYGLTPLFRSGQGPECRPLSFGITVNY